jgi:microcystin-dependent protein
MSAATSYNVSENPNDSNNGGAILPVGSMLLWATGTPPPEFLLCDGSIISRNTYSELFDTIGTTFGEGNGGTVTMTSATVTAGILIIQVVSNTFITSGSTFSGFGMTPTGGFLGGQFIATTANSSQITAPAGFAAGSYSGGILRLVFPTTFNLPNTGGKVIRGVNGTYSLGASAGSDSITLDAVNLPQHVHGYSRGTTTAVTTGGGGSVNFTGDTMNSFKTTASQTYDNGGAAFTQTAVSIVNSYLAINYIIKYM